MYVLIIRKTSLAIKEPIVELEMFVYQSIALIGIFLLTQLLKRVIKELKKYFVIGVSGFSTNLSTEIKKPNSEAL